MAVIIFREFIEEVAARMTETTPSQRRKRQAYDDAVKNGEAGVSIIDPGILYLNALVSDKDANAHRNRLGGWRHAGLPWQQG